MHARQQHFLGALGVVAAALSLNAYADFRLFLRNPAELEEIAKQALDALFPDYAPSMDAPEFVLSERRAIIKNLVLREKGDSGRTLFRVAAVEAEFSLVPPALRRVTMLEPEGTVRIAPDGSVNFDTGGQVGGGRPPTLYADLGVRVAGGHVRVIDERDGFDLLATDIQAEVSVARDLTVAGRGSATVGALYDPRDPLADGPRVAAAGTPEGRRFRPLFPHVGFDLTRDEAGRLRAEVRLQGGSCTPQLESVIPQPFRGAIWDELGPSGALDARVRIGSDDQGLRIAATILPLDTAIRPRGFPLDITDIRGRFEVVVALPRGAARPELIQVGWESVTARVGTGRAVSRGSAFPGAPGEHLTLMVYVDAYDVPLDAALRQALPADIREVYSQFDPQGTIQRAHVLVFKGPWAEEPQLSVHIDELAGTISAMYTEFPLRLQEVRGQFDIREDGNVAVRARGTFQHGGEGAVDAHVVKGDLLDVVVRARGVPVGPDLVACLQEGVRRRVEPFHLEGGLADIDVAVEKPRRGARPQPTIDVGLREVGLTHTEFPYPITASGRLRVVPRFPAAEDADPERVDIDLDLQGWGQGVVGAVVSGSIAVAPEGGFRGRLAGRADAVTLDEALRRALPGGLRDTFDRLAPRGAARRVELTVESPERFTARGEGEDLVIAPQAFPYAVHVDGFDVARVDEVVRIRAARGRSPGGGRWSGSGLVTLDAAGGPPAIDLGLEAEGLRLDAALVEALPEGDAKVLIRGLRPAGRAGAALRVRIPGAGEPRVDGTLDLAAATVHVDAVGPALVGLKDEPVTGLSGRLRLAVPAAVTLEGLEGRLAGARVTAAGTIAAASTAAVGSSPPGGGPAPPGAAGPAEPSARVDLEVGVEGLVLDARTRAMAGPRAADALARFRPSGPCDLRARIRREPGAVEPRVNLVARPRGLTVVPDLFPLQVEDVVGELELDDGEPVRVDITGRVGAGRLAVRRDRGGEGRFPGGGARGRVLELELRRFARPADPRDRAALERELPDRLLRLFTTFNPEGPLDVHAFVFQPTDGRSALRWVAEVRAGTPGPRPTVRDAPPPDGLALSTGLRFDGIRGVARASGTVAELERGACEGELVLDELEWRKQTVKNLRGRFRLQDGVFDVGLRGAPLTGDLYGGVLKLIVEYVVQTGQYRGLLGLEGGRMREALRELGRLRETPGSDADLPRGGSLDLSLAFRGGGRTLSGREVPLAGDGWLQIAGSNLLPRLDALGAFVGGSGTEVIYTRLELQPGQVRLDDVDLRTGGGVRLFGSGGTVAFDGDLSLTVVPFDTGSDLFQRLFENLPITGYHFRGKLWAPVPIPVPFASALEQLLKAILPGGGAGAPDEAPREPPAEPPPAGGRGPRDGPPREGE